MAALVKIVRGLSLLIVMASMAQAAFADSCKGPCFEGAKLPIPRPFDDYTSVTAPPADFHTALMSNECAGWAFDLGPCPVRPLTKMDAQWWLENSKTENLDDFELRLIRRKLQDKWKVCKDDVEGQEVRAILIETLRILESRYPTSSSSSEPLANIAR